MFASVLAVTQWIYIQRLSPENKGLSPNIPLQAGYRNKKQSLTHMWLHVVQLSGARPSSHLDFLSFISLLCHLLPAATLSK
jgi:hypothetical protein